ncbi:tyrosine-protein phosphatase [Microbacterium sp. JZ70]
MNIRDLGGLPTPLSPTGQTLRGRVARGPRRERLTADGWLAAREWGLRAVVDLRCAHEVGRRPDDPIVSEDALADLRIVQAPTEDQEDPEFRRVCFPLLDSPEYWAHNWRLLPGLVRAALVAVADAGAGVLVHCGAGRDRTGMLSALLLGNAGVLPDAVAEDYAESVRAMAAAAHHSPTGDRQSRWSPEEREAWIEEVSVIVREVAADVSRAFHVIGLDDAYRERLRSLLVDPDGAR